MASRTLDDLHPVVKKMAERFLQACADKGFPVTIVCTLRSFAEQTALYEQGRTKPGKIVTNARAGQSYHNYGLAFDAAPLVNGRIVWNRIDLFKQMGLIGQSVGLEWGGSWKKLVDYPHFQWTGGLSLKDLQAGKRPAAKA